MTNVIQFPVIKRPEPTKEAQPVFETSCACPMCGTELLIQTAVEATSIEELRELLGVPMPGA